ncbi:hypothetical protein CMV_020088 [Castanea mollissima]|uniref:Oligopeptidase A N-terminal domain-containing protein n=1 Tax=Castanea mollissima TaxID=60419 RepID=A0A8J4QX64_9ROSI|nr:hypothetical protein CMV_020088 [Castanea mollissima]
MCKPLSISISLLITNPTSFLSHSSFSCSATLLSSSLPVEESIENNPLLQDFDFPPFDVVEAKHVRPGIRALSKKLEDDLLELERTMDPSWPRLVEPLEKIVDRLTMVWGIVNHLKVVKDSLELCAAIKEVQAD